MAKDKAQDQEEQEYIEVVGASEHNLKHVSLKIPRNQLVVITGLSSPCISKELRFGRLNSGMSPAKYA